MNYYLAAKIREETRREKTIIDMFLPVFFRVIVIGSPRRGVRGKK